MSKFCHNCGFKQARTDAKFCDDCGTNLQSLAAAKPAPAQAAAPAPAWAEDEDSDDIDSPEYWAKIRNLRRNMSELEVQIDRPPVVQGEQLGAIAARKPLDTSEFRNGTTPDLTKEQIAEQFKREAGSRVEESRTHKVTIDEK